MSVNNPKKINPPVVDKSLETTRNIEYQLLNMKEELERFSEVDQPDIDLAPAVSHTFEILQQIDNQLQNMRTLLEHYSNLFKYKGDEPKFTAEGLYQAEKPGEPPFPPTKRPTYPPTYPTEEQVGYYPYPRPPYNPYYAPQMNPYQYYYGQPYQMPMFSGPYGPFMSYPPYGQPLPPEYPDPYQAPYQAPPEDMYYQSAKYPTVASSEPAYSSSSKSRAVPRHTFKIAYYPWQQITGKKGPTDSRTPYMNIYDLGNIYQIYIELPGVEKENLELRVDEQSIWINGKPTIMGSEDGVPVVQEHGYHEFYRQVYLPSKIISNKTDCVFENGILIIKLVKTNPRKQPHRVKIR